MKAIQVVLFVCFALTITFAQAQGPLAPSGAPEATMKTLDQVEARIPISQIPYTCEVAGASYYLTGDLTGIAGESGILISAPDVTLDLNGFTLYGDSGSGDTGIMGDSGADNLRIFNGTVRDWGSTFYGVDCAGEYVAVSGVRAFNNGGGIMLSDNSSAVDCIAANNSSAGIIVRHNGRVENCVAVSNAWHGIYGWKSNVVRNCKASQNSSSGIELQGGGHMTDNTSLNNGTGLRITVSGTYVAGNIVKGNAVNYDFADGNQLNILLCEIPETLDWPCTAVLAGSLTCSTVGTNGVSIRSDNVTLDLAGHELIGPGVGSGMGIYCGYGNGTIMNGVVRNWQGGLGIGAFGRGASIKNMHVTDNNEGITIRNAALIESCQINGNLDDGVVIDGSGNIIRNCRISTNLSEGIVFDTFNENLRGNVIENSTVTQNGASGLKFYSTAGDFTGILIKNCTFSYNAASGILFVGHLSSAYFEGISMLDCVFSGNNGAAVSGTATGACHGLVIDSCNFDNNLAGLELARCSGSRIVNNTFSRNAGSGIYLTSSTANRIDGNTIYGWGGDYGIYTDEASCSDNLIVRNQSGSHTTDFSISSADTYGPVVTAAGELDTTGSATHPWANFDL
ncbi:MAG TPA: right-handed parallel beta-helix repeat-containing protein [Kiritimatiellia bacterium]|nr:right-handed parallel beta-helix repeat-containing protein [Kiritimatiellia bacterium]